MEVDETGLGLCQVLGFGISSIEPSDSTTIMLVAQSFFKQFDKVWFVCCYGK